MAGAKPLVWRRARAPLQLAEDSLCSMAGLKIGLRERGRAILVGRSELREAQLCVELFVCLGLKAIGCELASQHLNQPDSPMLLVQERQ